MEVTMLTQSPTGVGVTHASTTATATAGNEAELAWYINLQQQQSMRKILSPTIKATTDSGFVDDDDMEVLREHVAAGRPARPGLGKPGPGDASAATGSAADAPLSLYSTQNVIDANHISAETKQQPVQVLRNAKEVAAIAALTRFRVTAQSRMAPSVPSPTPPPQMAGQPRRDDSPPPRTNKSTTTADAAAFRANVKATTKAFQGASINKGAGLAADLARFRAQRAAEVEAAAAAAAARGSVHSESETRANKSFAYNPANPPPTISVQTVAAVATPPNRAGGDDGGDDGWGFNDAALELAHFRVGGASPFRDSPSPTKGISADVSSGATAQQQIKKRPTTPVPKNYTGIPRRGEPCPIEACSNKVICRGVCYKHGALGVCNHPSCITNAVVRGYCTKHDSERKTCIIDACSNGAQARGMCKAHAPKRECSIDGCSTGVQARGVCRKHTSKKVCCAPACNTKVVPNGRGLCTKHGAFSVCSADRCESVAASASGLCFKHGARGVCTIDNCETNALSRGLCFTHGGGTKKACTVKGCSSFAHARDLCTKHGAHGMCRFGNCSTNAMAGYPNCYKHGGGRKKPQCSMDGCTTTSQRKKLCGKHGGGLGPCSVDGCKNKEVRNHLCKKHGAMGHCSGTAGTKACKKKAFKVGGNCREHVETKMEV